MTISTDTEITIPPTVARCPYCEAEITVQTSGWQEDTDGSYFATEVQVNCPNEFLDEDTLDPAHDDQMPYVNMLPVHQIILRWMKREYRFEM